MLCSERLYEGRQERDRYKVRLEEGKCGSEEKKEKKEEKKKEIRVNSATLFLIRSFLRLAGYAHFVPSFFSSRSTKVQSRT